MNKIYLCRCGKARSHEFLFYVLEKFYGKIANESQLQKTECGKLFLPDLDINFNISHSEDLVAIAFGENELGLDVEKIREKDFSKVSNKYFGNEPKNCEEFFTLWTKAESFVKYMASSVLLSLKKIVIDGNGFIYDGQKSNALSKTESFNGYLFSLTTLNPVFEIIEVTDFE